MASQDVEEHGPETPRTTPSEASARASEALMRATHFAAAAEIRLDELGRSQKRTTEALGDFQGIVMREFAQLENAAAKREERVMARLDEIAAEQTQILRLALEALNKGNMAASAVESLRAGA